MAIGYDGVGAGVGDGVGVAVMFFLFARGGNKPSRNSARISAFAATRLGHWMFAAF
jgi:hypothetical protein